MMVYSLIKLQFGDRSFGSFHHVKWAWSAKEPSFPNRVPPLLYYLLKQQISKKQVLQPQLMLFKQQGIQLHAKIAYGRIATTYQKFSCQHLMQLQPKSTHSYPLCQCPSKKHLAILHNQTHLTWYIPAVTLICLMHYRLIHTHKTELY